MDHFQNISPQMAYQRMQADTSTVLFDIRDPASFDSAHANNAQHLTNDTMLTLLEAVEYEQPIFVICYHGISSQGAAQYLVNQGYDEVYSVDGGFEAWQREGLPIQTPNL